MTGVQIMVVLIVAMALVASVIRARYTARPEDKVDVDRMREEIQALRDRVAVLERIATENQNSLAHEIERLRDR
ncbi:MAG: hypothetical protein M3N07_00285 [Pseudomonadota bacterium]|nr:hypothetical protein [Pseudomonadota bacterium]